MDKNLIEKCISELRPAGICKSIVTVGPDTVRSVLRSRPAQAHKGDLGHALLYAGSPGMAGAAVLSARACMRSGVGLLTVCTPSFNNDILQISVPEAMVIHSDDLYADTDLSRYNAVGAGPGLGKGESQTAILEKLLKRASYPMVLDADALNIISTSRYLNIDRYFGEHLIFAVNSRGNINHLLQLHTLHNVWRLRWELSPRL